MLIVGLKTAVLVKDALLWYNDEKILSDEEKKIVEDLVEKITEYEASVLDPNAPPVEDN